MWTVDVHFDKKTVEITTETHRLPRNVAVNTTVDFDNGIHVLTDDPAAGNPLLVLLDKRPASAVETCYDLFRRLVVIDDPSNSIAEDKFIRAFRNWIEAFVNLTPPTTEELQSVIDIDLKWENSPASVTPMYEGVAWAQYRWIIHAGEQVSYDGN